jgi:hypothetical protein
MRSLSVAVIALVGSLAPALAHAKSHGMASPGGRRIYQPDETFQETLDQNVRQFVVEAAVGAGPEGNVGLLLGWINKPVRGVEFYAGVGIESNPARQYTGTVRYLFNIDGYRPYLGAGYLFKDLYVLRTHSHNVFAEAGYSWVLHHTYHLTAGIGVRYMASVGIRSDSPLLANDVDPASLAEQEDALVRWVPTAVLRFSRAF